MTLCSVIIPSYNHAHCLPEAVGSVLAQACQDFEIIIVNDGSTDNTVEVTGAFTDPRIRVIHQENRGLAGARNAGIERARGEFVAFLDADDILNPNHLEALLEAFAQNPSAGMTTGGWQYTSSDGTVLSESRPWEIIFRVDLPFLLTVYSLPMHTLLVRRRWLDQIGGFDPELRCVEDWDFWLRLANAGCPIALAKAVVCQYRMTGSNMSLNGARMRAGYLKVLDKFFNRPDLNEEAKPLKNITYAHAYLTGACQEYAAGQLDEARADLARAVEINPALMDNRGQPVVDCLVTSAFSPYHHSPLAFLDSVFAKLPAALAPVLAKRRREITARVAAELFFKAFEARDWQVVRRMILPAALNDPRWLANRGFISISIRAAARGFIPGGTRRAEPRAQAS